ncbi:RnfABCDGE type electron transport complex subunit G [bacterium]|nr:RnfABCDGE type electron transport complex subunit G [bacterium]
MGLLLALVYGVTKEPIAESKRLDKQQKLAQVMPGFDNDPLTTEVELSDTVLGYAGMSGADLSGIGMTSSVNTGYSGYFSIVFGITKDNTIERVRILESFETPGLGSKASEPFFIDQFEGRPAEPNFKVAKDNGDIDAITGATITSRAVCDALNAGLEAYQAAGGAAALAPAAPETTAEGKLVNPLLEKEAEPVTEAETAAPAGTVVETTDQSAGETDAEPADVTEDTEESEDTAETAEPEPPAGEETDGQ